MNQRRYSPFDGNPHISPLGAIFLIFGIFMLAIPPVGLILLALAIYWQVRFRRRVRRIEAFHRAAHAARAERDRRQAVMSL